MHLKKFKNTKLSVKGFLIINYLVTFIILYIIIQLSYKTTNFILESFIFKNNKISNVSVSTYYNMDFNKIKLGFLSELNGWEEVLDENKKVIYIKGKKKDSTMQYTEKQLFELSSFGKYSPKTPYFGEVFSVKGKHRKSCFFIYKIDRRKLSHSATYKPNLSSTTDSILSLKLYGTLYLIRAFFLLIGIYIYSVISSKFITTPLNTFINSIKNLKSLNYNTRANINGLKELQHVESEFNEMVTELENVKKENKKIDESKKRLLVDISHDLKTPITSIQGYSKILLDENITTEEKNKFLKIIYNKSVYSTILIDDLFALSKLEDSEYKLSLEKLDFTEWLRRLVIEYYEEFQNKHFDLNLSISEYPIVFNFDKKLMKRALSNILSNALKHNKAYTLLSIGAYLKDNNVIIEIGNNERPIDKSIRATIFEPFVRAEDTNSSGSGLGLAITKKIIEKHEGNIKLTSSASDNNLFVICIPANYR